MRIGIDLMGGDFAPREAILGIKEYLASGHPAARLVLTGDTAQVQPLLDEAGIPAEAVELVHAPEVIGMHEHPTRALKEKPASSIAVGFGLLARDQMDAFISAGNTGAMLVGTHFSIGSLPGVLRPSISTIIPQHSGATSLLLDVGLNADCKPEMLNQFAIMGSVYAQLILGIEKPRVALINVGEEEGKGNQLAQATYPLLRENKHIHFTGNIEGRDILLDKADVMVCEGFTGNVILKLAESLFDIGQRETLNNTYLNRFNFEIYGGTPVLGVAKPVIIGHGISRAPAFANMIRLAEAMLEKKVMQKMAEELAGE